MRGHAPCKISNSISPQNNGCQSLWAPTSQKVGVGGPAYHKKDGATLNPGACRFNLQYDWRHDERLGVWVGTWNMGSRNRKGGSL